MSLGFCVPQSFCSTLSCEDAKKAIPGNFELELKDCDIHCCDEDYCNGPSRPPVSATQATNPPTAPVQEDVFVPGAVLN